MNDGLRSGPAPVQGAGEPPAPAGRARPAGGKFHERKQGFPFVPFITAGALLTAVFAGNLPPPLIDLGILIPEQRR